MEWYVLANWKQTRIKNKENNGSWMNWATPLLGFCAITDIYTLAFSPNALITYISVQPSFANAPPSILC